MIISIILVLLVTASGTIATYLYDEDAPFAARLCSGACIGITTLGLVCFVFASFLGLTNITIIITVLLVAVLPLLLIKSSRLWPVVRQDLKTTSRKLRRSLSNPSAAQIGHALFYLVVTVVFWRVFQRAMIEEPEGISTGVINNFGDLPFHLSVITSFAFGNNFPPQDPTYAGVHFTYPFLTDFVSAIFVRCGAELRQAMFLENFVVSVAFVGVMHRWALELVRDKLAALITPLLVLLNGGFGWIFLRNLELLKPNTNFAGMVQNLPASFTINNTGLRWGNAISTLLIPQRGFLLGLPLAVIVFTQWWKATGNDEGIGDEGKGGKGEGGKEEQSGTWRETHPPQLQHNDFPSSPFPRFPHRSCG